MEENATVIAAYTYDAANRRVTKSVTGGDTTTYAYDGGQVVQEFTQANGITQLMEDLGKANSSNNPDIIMLGGGNPALIPEANAIFVRELQELIASTKVDQMIFQCPLILQIH